MEMANLSARSSAKPADRDELASAKLWAVYISEAEKYDKTLVEGWKSDMEGLLIFAGLFSASLTAFLVESYKTLSPDQGAITAELLAQISRQLDPGSTTHSAVTLSSSFTPSAASLACNILWFLSLGLSLSCALIATLVEQWARDFVQRTEMRPSPVVRARILSYLYFGMRRFGMHAMVEFIPLLLHVSLLLFFAGLVAFLLPINRVLTFVAAALLTWISAIYIYFTILPIISSDAPYRTPLSNVAWGLYQRLSALLYWRQKSPSDEESGITDQKCHPSDKSIPTMVAVMNRDATMHSSERNRRDGQAIVWTLKSLTDNNELQPFVEALPDLIGGANGRRGMYDHMINMLLADRDIRLVQRIENLLQTCDSGLLHPDHESRRRITCTKALWAITYFLATDASTQETFPVFNKTLLSSQLAHPHPVISYSASTIALVQWIGFCAVSAHVQTVLSMLAVSPAGDDLGTLATAFRAIQLEADVRGYVDFSSDISRISSSISRIIALIPGDGFLSMKQCRDTMVSFEDKAYDSFVDYIQSSASLDEMPYEFRATCEIIQPSSRAINSIVRTKLEKALTATIDNKKTSTLAYGVHQIDIIVDMVLYLLRASLQSMDLAIAKPIVIYIADRRSGIGGLTTAFGRCNPHHLCSTLTNYLESGPGYMEDAILYSIWGLCMHYPKLAVFDEQTLAVVCASSSRALPLFPCAIAVVKSRIFSAAAELSPNQAHSLMDRLQILPSIDLTERLKGTAFTVLIDFLEQFDHPVAQLATTFNFLALRCPRGHYPLSFQQRFSTWLLGRSENPSMGAEFLSLVAAIMDWLFWIAEHFDDPGVRRTLAETLTKYLGIFSQNETREARHRITVTIARLRSHSNRTENDLPVDNTTPEVESDLP